MPPKNQVSGGKQGHQAASAAGKAAMEGSLPHIDRLLQMAVMAMDAPMFHKFLTHSVSSLYAFENDWVQADCRGSVMVPLGPERFSLEVRNQFPQMTIATRTQLVEVITAKVIRESELGNGFIAEEVATKWKPQASIRFEGSQGTLLSPSGHQASLIPASADPKKIVIGGHKLALFANSPNKQSLAANQGNALPANLGPLPANQGNALPANLGPQPAYLGHLFSPPPFAHGHQRDMILAPQAASAEEQISLATSILQAHGLTYTVSAQSAWDRRAAARDQVQDPSMPPGFDKIDIHDKIERAIADRTAKGNLGLQANAKRVAWPTMKLFDQKSFVECRRQYYECVIASLLGGIFQPFKDCLEAEARSGACFTFGMDDNDFTALSDAEFMADCITYFGPKNLSQALTTLDAIRLEKHSDRLHSQATFVAKFE
jgi:hypothetical protein